jgi:hypothetical protein
MKTSAHFLILEEIIPHICASKFYT